MQEIAVTYGRAARIGWTWLWRTLVLTVLICLALRTVTDRMLGAHAPVANLEHQLADPVVSTVCGLLMLHSTLRSSFGTFRIALVKHRDHYIEPF